ncbi:MAG: RluA family pseudouridine synthase [Chloroflexota bacterium]
MQISTQIKQVKGGTTLIEYMAKRFTYRSIEEWNTLIVAGNILLNGKSVAPESAVNAGDVIATLMPDPEKPDANFSYTIVYEDEVLVGVNKPPNLRVHGRGRFIHANLIHHIRHDRQPPYPGVDLVNRLDANSSGLILLAKDKATMGYMQALFRERSITKKYLALVSGIPQPGEGVVERPIGQLPSAEGVYRFGDGPDAIKVKLAATRYRVLATYQDRYALVECMPVTGRTHQIRVHMQMLGCPLVGDWLYQLSDEAYLERVRSETPNEDPVLSRHALHCAAYRFIHPLSRNEVEIEAPLVEDMAFLISSLQA